MTSDAAALTERRPLRGLRGRAAAAVAELPRAGLAVLGAGALAGFLAFPTEPNYDSLYALIWGRDLLDGSGMAFDTYRAPTEHPLLVAAGVILGPLGETGARLLVLSCLASLLALVAAMYRLGAAAAGVLGGVIAAALIASRLNLWLLASLGFLDIPYCALVAWAAVLEVERRRRGGPVWVLLALAGLLRPEAWALAALYAGWMGLSAPWVARARYAASAAAAPALWMGLDLVVTGNPLFSFQHTDALALELQRERPLSTVPWLMVRLLAEILKWPVLAAGVAGLVIAVGRRRSVLAVPALLVAVTCAEYLVIATGGLPTVYRYLLVAAVGIAAFASYALAGWTTLPASNIWRSRWAAAAALVGLGGALYTATHTNPANIRAELRDRHRINEDLRSLLAAPGVAQHRRCGPVSVPNHKLRPHVRWFAGLDEEAVLARSDTSRGPQRRGVAIVIDPALERRPALNVYEVPRDDGARLQLPPAGFVALAANRSFSAWGRC